MENKKFTWWIPVFFVSIVVICLIKRYISKTEYYIRITYATPITPRHYIAARTSPKLINPTWQWPDMRVRLYPTVTYTEHFIHKASIRGGRKNCLCRLYICLEACCRKGWGAGEVTPPPSPRPYFPADIWTDISYKDDITVILLLGVSFMILSQTLPNYRYTVVLYSPYYFMFGVYSVVTFRFVHRRYYERKKIFTWQTIKGYIKEFLLLCIM